MKDNGIEIKKNVKLLNEWDKSRYQKKKNSWWHCSELGSLRGKRYGIESLVNGSRLVEGM